MTVISDQNLRHLIESGRIGLDPYDPARIQSASVDICLGHEFRVMRNDSIPYIDVRKPVEGMWELVTKDEDEGFVLHPGEFALGTTLEYVRVPNDLVCRLEGKSSLGRLGLVIHSTAGWIDPGFEGNITLEMSNDANVPIVIYPEMPVGQFTFMKMDQEVEKPYRGKYHGQTDPRASRMHENFGSSLTIKDTDIEVHKQMTDRTTGNRKTVLRHRPTDTFAQSEWRFSKLEADQEALTRLREALAKL